MQTKTQRVPGERLDGRFSCFFCLGYFLHFWFTRSAERTGSTGRQRSPVFISTGLSLCINISANNHHSIPTANCRHSWVPAGAPLKQPRPPRAGRVAHTHLQNHYHQQGQKEAESQVACNPPFTPPLSPRLLLGIPAFVKVCFFLIWARPLPALSSFWSSSHRSH